MALNPNEELNPVRVFEVRYKCEACGEGSMVATKEPIEVLMTDPPQYPDSYRHVCNKSGHEAMLPKQYPYMALAREDQP